METILSQKDLRMAIIKEIYEGRGSIDTLKGKFGADAYDATLKFLTDLKFIQAKDRLPAPPPKQLPNGYKYIQTSGDTLSWELTTTGTIYYEFEIENEKKKISAHIIHASNSAVNIDSPGAQQIVSVEQGEITPEIRDLLNQLKDALEKRDSDMSFRILERLKSGAENVFWNLVASGVYSLIK